jgi:hypothetical protein
MDTLTRKTGVITRRKGNKTPIDKKKRQPRKIKRELSSSAARCIKKFLRFFPGGFSDETYLEWERNYKWNAHLLWIEMLNEERFGSLLSKRRYSEIARLAAGIEGKTNFLFSFEKMALRDAITTTKGAKDFSIGLFKYIYGLEPMKERFEQFTEVLASLPRKQTRVLTWPLQTVFGFIADPQKYFFLKPRVTQLAAKEYGYVFSYRSRPNWETYKGVLDLAGQVKRDLADLEPRDLIDVQSFLWVLGSDEYK